MADCPGISVKRIPLLLGGDHACSYLPGRLSRLAFVAPAASMDRALYSALADKGFRRSGDMVYRPYCAGCHACIPVRVPVERFRPNRAQSRVLRRNEDLAVIVQPAAFSEEHYLLFRGYLDSRHGESDMTASTREQYMDFLSSDWAHTSFVEFRDRGRLAAIAVVDHLRQGLSAVYTFFDPAQHARSPGTNAVLWQIAEARRLNLEWLYLGFWVGACRKMTYKEQFRPLQAFVDDGWHTFEKGEKIPG